LCAGIGKVMFIQDRSGGGSLRMLGFTQGFRDNGRRRRRRKRRLSRRKRMRRR